MSIFFREQQRFQFHIVLFICFLIIVSSNVLAQNRPTRKPNNAIYNPLSLAFSPDGKTLAISRGIEDRSQRHGQIDLWDVETKKLKRVIKGFDGPVWSVAFSPDNKTLISGSSEFRGITLPGQSRGSFYTEIKWWDVETGELKFKQTKQAKEPRMLVAATSANGKVLAKVDYYTEVTMISPSLIDASSDSFNSMPSMRSSFGFISSTNFVDLNLVNAQTGVVNIESKRIFKSNIGSFYRRGGSFNIGSESLSNGVIFSPTGNLLAVGTPAEVKIYDTETGKQTLKLKDFKGNARTLTFSPDGRILGIASFKSDRSRSGNIVSYTLKSEINFYDVQTGKVVKKLTGSGSVFYMSFIPESGKLLVGLNDYELNKPLTKLNLIDFEGGKVSEIMTRSTTSNSFFLSPNGRFLALMGGSSEVVLWDLKTRKAIHSFEPVKDKDDENNQTASRYILDVNKILDISFSADGKSLVAGTEKNEIKIWDPRTGAAKAKLIGHEGAVLDVAISSDGNNLISNSDDQTIRIWDIQTGKQKIVINNDENEIVSSKLSPDGKLIAGSSGNTVILWDAQSGELQKKIISQERSLISSVIFTPNGQNLVGANEEGSIQSWNLATGEIEKSFDTNSKITAINFSPNSRILAVATDTGAINVWDFQTGQLIKNLKKDNFPINALAFSKDGKWMASGGDERKTIIWETASWKAEHTMKGLDLAITSLDFSPDGEFLASGSGNVSVVLWNVKTGKLERILK